jgi:phosphatidylinositol 4-kinase
MGGLDSPGFAHFKKLFKEGFETARKHSDSIISEFAVHRHRREIDSSQTALSLPAMVELMQRSKTTAVDFVTGEPD